MEDDRTFGQAKKITANIEDLKLEERELSVIIDEKKKKLEQIESSIVDALAKRDVSLSDEFRRNENAIVLLNEEKNRLEEEIKTKNSRINDLSNQENELIKQIEDKQSVRDSFMTQVDEKMNHVNKLMENAEVRAAEMKKQEEELNLAKQEFAKLKQSHDADVLNHINMMNEIKEKESGLVFLKQQSDEKEAHAVAVKAEAERIMESVKKREQETILLNDRARRDSEETNGLLNDIKRRNDESIEREKKNEETRLGLVKWKEDLEAQDTDLKRRQRLSTLNDSQ